MGLLCVFSCLHASMDPHVHLVKGGAEAVIRLSQGGGQLKLVRVYGMKTSDIVRAVRLVEVWNDDLLAMWKAIHGE